MNSVFVGRLRINSSLTRLKLV